MGETEVHEAVRRNDWETIAKYTGNAQCLHPQLNGNMLLLSAVELQSQVAFDAPLKAGADPNAPNPKTLQSLSAAVQKGNVAIVQALAREGADCSGSKGAELFARDR
jgi:hypothetical protein